MTFSSPASSVQAGDPVPNVAVASCDGLHVKTHYTGAIFGQGRCIVVGVVGAFTPVCSNDHLPEFIHRSVELGKRGYSRIFCVAPNDPWTVAAWARAVDPKRRLSFLSDGNLAFGRAMGICRQQDAGHFFGERNDRYLLLLQNGEIERLSVEIDPYDLACTGVASLEKRQAAHSVREGLD